MSRDIVITNNEVFFEFDELIVSKTDLKGHILYANDVFLKIAGYEESEILGQPHSIIRHPDMPRCIFKLLWTELEAGNEIFAFVKNRTKTGDHYWVNAHVTPSLDSSGKITGYHSTRRLPERRVIEDIIIPLYKDLLTEENRHTNRKTGMESSCNMIANILQERGLDYDEFVQTL